MLRFNKYINNTLLLITSLFLCYTNVSVATTTSDSNIRTAAHGAIHHNTKSHIKSSHKQHKTNQQSSHKKLKSHAQVHNIHATKNKRTQHLQLHANSHKIKSTHHIAHKSNHVKNNVQHQNNNQLVNSHNAQQSQHALNIQNNNALQQQHSMQRSIDHPAVATASRHSALAFNTLSPSETTGERVVSFVHEVVGSLRYTRYAYGAGVFDSKYGVYKLDCSHYVDNILHRVDPTAYASLEAGTGAQMPNSENYYDFFSRLSDHLRYDWDKVDNAKELQPGDVLVFRFKNPYGMQEGGHVMLVMDKPVIDNDALLVRVTDSAAAGHSDDTRPAHNSGVGIGTLLLKVDSYTGQPSAYAWEFNSPWKSSVDIAMARPSSLG